MRGKGARRGRRRPVLRSAGTDAPCASRPRPSVGSSSWWAIPSCCPSPNRSRALAATSPGGCEDRDARALLYPGAEGRVSRTSPIASGGHLPYLSPGAASVHRESHAPYFGGWNRSSIDGTEWCSCVTVHSPSTPTAQRAVVGGQVPWARILRGLARQAAITAPLVDWLPRLRPRRDERLARTTRASRNGRSRSVPVSQSPSSQFSEGISSLVHSANTWPPE
jgi:hypothetical protein